jgi:hypothetical protein
MSGFRSGARRPPVDLRPVAARLERARKHVDELDAILAAYIARPPYVVRPDLGSAPDRVVERAELRDEPPLEAAMAVSDAVHQARAALDNLVNAVRTGGPADNIGFPIRATEPAYRAAARTMLEGVPTPICDAIAAVQPWSNDVRRWVGDELLSLHDLARLDRHRLPPIQAAVVAPHYVESDAGEGTVIAFRMDRGGRWAETEYVVGRAARVHFLAEVRFAAGAGDDAAGMEVGTWTRRLVDVAASAVDVVIRAPAR